MKIKRFVDKDSRGAMAQARSALGPEAVILSNKRVGNQIELVAAIDIDEIARLAEDSDPATADTPAGLTLVNSSSTLSGLQEELGQLRSMVEGKLSEDTQQPVSRLSGSAEQILSEVDTQRFAPEATGSEDLLLRLLDFGLSRGLTDVVVRQLPETETAEDAWQLAMRYLCEQLPVMHCDALVDGGGRVALLGTTGVGKTTTLAKLAARYSLRHGKQHLAIVSTDCYRVGGQEQLQAFADYLDVPVFMASDARELRMALDQLQHKKMVLIDTPGFSQRDSRLAAQLELLTASGYATDSYLVLPATCAQKSLLDVVNAYEKTALSGAIVTKIDEAVELGGVIDVAVEARLPLAYMGTGQKVPEDLAPIEAQEFMNRALTRDVVEQRQSSLSQTLQNSLAAAMNRAIT